VVELRRPQKIHPATEARRMDNKSAVEKPEKSLR
jgi:hypothetical protein